MSIKRSEITKFKQQDLADYLPIQILKIAAVHKKWKEKYGYNFPLLFIDGSAGDLDPNYITSPQLFIETVFRIKETRADLCLIERGKDSSNKITDTFEYLEKNYYKGYYKYKPININAFLMKTELQDHLDNFIKPQTGIFGLLYFDPYGFQIDSYKSIISFCKKFPKVDLCLNLNTNMIQRLRQVPQTSFNKYNGIFLSTILREIRKDHIWLRDNEVIPAKNIQKWVMVYASNWIGSAPNQKHFHHIDSPKGQQIISKYNYCDKELKNEGRP